MKVILLCSRINNSIHYYINSVVVGLNIRRQRSLWFVLTQFLAIQIAENASSFPYWSNANY